MYIYIYIYIIFMYTYLFAHRDPSRSIFPLIFASSLLCLQFFRDLFSTVALLIFSPNVFCSHRSSMHSSLLSNSLLPATLSGLVLTFIQSDPARFFSSCYPLFFSLLLWSSLLSSYLRVFSPLLCSPLCLLFCALLFSSTHTSLHVSSFLWSHLLASS